MIEIMCRDGKTPDEELEKIADMVFHATGIDTEVIYEQDRRAMVFWGPEDVKEIVENLKLKSIDIDDTTFCDTIVKAAEPNIHQAMLEAGHDVLFDEVCDTAQSMGEEINFDDPAVDDDLPFAEPVAQ